MTQHAAVYRAHDASERRRLLTAIGQALDNEDYALVLALDAEEGEDTSAYVFGLVYAAAHEAFNEGFHRGRRVGVEDAFGAGPMNAVARAKARQARKPKRKRGKR